MLVHSECDSRKVVSLVGVACCFGPCRRAADATVADAAAGLLPPLGISGTGRETALSLKTYKRECARVYEQRASAQ